MKNLLIYINPSKKFDRETDTLAKIQIDNSLDLGWKKEDIMIFTNFKYEYNGVKAQVVNEESFCPFRPLSTKTVTVAKLLKENLIQKNEIYWVHDFDAYQMNIFPKKEIELKRKDIALTDYGWAPKWCLGSYFFVSSSKDFFNQLKDIIYKYRLEDERALVLLATEKVNAINDRIKKLNITYNFGMRKVGYNYQKADKPIKVLHFHPWTRGKQVLECFMGGKNELGFPLMDNRLKNIFNKNAVMV